MSKKFISFSSSWLFYSDSLCYKQTQIVGCACLSSVLISKQGPQSCLHTPPFRLNEKINELGWAVGNATTFSASDSSVRLPHLPFLSHASNSLSFIAAAPAFRLDPVLVFSKQTQML